MQYPPHCSAFHSASVGRFLHPAAPLVRSKGKARGSTAGDRTSFDFTLLFCLSPHTLLGKYTANMTAAESNQLPVAAHGSLERRSVASTSSIAASSGSANKDHGDVLAAAHLDTKLPSELVYSLVLNWRGSKQQVTVVESDTVSLFSRWGRCSLER